MSLDPLYLRPQGSETVDEDHPGLSEGELDPILLGNRRIRLKPLIYELKIATKSRGIRRIGDVINPAQEDFLDECERQLNENGMIRVVVLKARQMGISTIIEAILFVLSIMFHNFQSLIISHEADSAEHILGITKRYWSTYPFKNFHVEQYSARKQLAWSDLESNIVVATAKNVGAGRSKTLHALHASEVGFWDKPDELVTGLRQSIPSFGLTCIFNESTANGVGNYFHNLWNDAEAGRSEYVGKFYPWFWHPEYTSSYIPPHEQGKYVELENMSEEELVLRSMGVTVPKLLWRRWAIVNLCNNDVDVFKQEYPSTAMEAFLSTGRNVFRLPDLTAHYLPMEGERGYLKKDVDGFVKFYKHHKGHLKIFRHPSKDRNWGVYQIGGDPTHTTVGDMACAQVISRRTLEQVAVFRKHTNPTDFGRDMVLLGEYYNQAMLVPEKEGPGYATVGMIMGLGYPNVYETQRVTVTPGKVNHDVFGWGTNASTKQLAISRLVDQCAQPVQVVGGSRYGLIIHDADTFAEMRDYVVNEKGEFQNGNGSKFDDTVMALGIAVATHFIEPPLRPYAPEQATAQVAAEVMRVAPELATGRKADVPREQEAMVDQGHSWEGWEEQ